MKNKKMLILLVIVCIALISSIIAITESRVRFVERDQVQSLAENNNMFLRIGACSSHCGSLNLNSHVEYINGTFDCVCSSD